MNKLSSSSSAVKPSHPQFHRSSQHITSFRNASSSVPKQSSGSSGSPTGKVCWRCGGWHLPHLCGFKHCSCYNCGKLGHRCKMCRQTSQHGTNHHMISLATPVTGGEAIPPASKEHALLSMSDKSKPIVVDVRVNDIAVGTWRDCLRVGHA